MSETYELFPRSRYRGTPTPLRTGQAHEIGPYPQAASSCVSPIYQCDVPPHGVTLELASARVLALFVQGAR